MRNVVSSPRRGSSRTPPRPRPLRGWAGLVGLGLALAGACSQGAVDDPHPFPPQGPQGPQSTTGSSATFGIDDSGSCCVANGSPGCDEPIVEACVCAEMVECCSDEWTARCAGMVDELRCGACGPDPSDTTPPDPDGTTSPPSGQDCCAGGSEPGCNDPAVEACVCGEIAFCCDTGWEKVCASAVEALGCGHCGGADTGEPPPPGESSGGEPPPPPPPMGDCCEVQMTPGCADAAVQDCVCAQDDYCCMMEWDQLCVDQVDELMCGDCGGVMPPPGVSPCCEAQMGPGCGDTAIEDCVCLIDDYCCNVEWDSA
ncbi:MAG: hypothetical protein KDK70_36120, partial [Myxococcales bacterium]|nr:hypothetical protein [Myxococcales bacterium]